MGTSSKGKLKFNGISLFRSKGEVSKVIPKDYTSSTRKERKLSRLAKG